MGFQNKKKIANRMMFIFAIIIVISLFLLLAVVIHNVTKLANDDTAIISENTVERYGGYVSSEIDRIMTVSETMSNTMEALLADGGITRETGISMLNRVLEKNPTLIGVYFCFEPGAFDGQDARYKNTSGHDATGRYIPYVFRKESGDFGIQALQDYDRDDYYQLPKKTNTSHITEPLLYDVNGQQVLMVSLVVPIQDNNGKFIGIAACDMTIDHINNELAEIKPYKSTGYLSLFSESGSVLASGSSELVGLNISQIGFATEEFINSIESARNFEMTLYNEELHEDYLTTGIHFPIRGTENTWCIAVNIPMKEVFREKNQITRLFSILSFVLLGAILLATYFLVRAVVIPIKVGVSFAESISQGDLTANIDATYLKKKDEIGELANALNNMKNNLLGIISNVKTAAENVASGSEEISSTSQQMSQGASEQAASAEEVSSSMEQMGANIKQNADNALQTEKISQKAAEDTNEGGNAVTEAVEAMNEIASKIGIIEEIARNTNLLALNAAIEAARAGEHGKGFAVVAAEVRKLAERSQEAAGEISELSTKTVGVADIAGEKLQKIVPDIRRTAELVQEISAASNEQNSGAEQINKAILQLDQVIQQNASASEEMASMAEELSGQAEQLQATISFFKLNDDTLSIEKGIEESRNENRSIDISHAKKNKEKDRNNEMDTPDMEKGIRLSKSNEVLSSVLNHGKNNGDELDQEFEEF